MTNDAISKAAKPPVVADGGAIRVLCKAFNMHESFADTDDEPKLRDYLRNMAGLSDYQIDTTLLAMSSKADDVLREIEQVLERTPELNMSNFDVDDVAALNSGMIEVYQIVQSANASLTMESGDGR